MNAQVADAAARKTGEVNPQPSAAGCRTLTLQQPHGPLVVDIWEPRRPAADVLPVLLIHGWGGSGSYWRETARALAETAQVIVPDLPGTGRSLPVKSAQNLFDQVANLEAMLDALALERVQVVGHSMGGAMALLLADAQPARVSRLVLTSLCFFLTEEQQLIYRTVMKIFNLSLPFRASWMGDLPLLPQLMARRYFYRVPDDPRLLRQGLDDYLGLDSATAAACARDAADEAIPAAGARLRLPVLLVACRQDRVMPVENVAHTAQVIPNCQVQWINKCGHMPMVEKPAKYLLILQEFLQL